MSSQDFKKFEILRYLAVSGIKSDNFQTVSNTALKMAADYVGLNAAAIFLWNDKLEITTSVSYADSENLKNKLEKMEDDLFLKLRKEKHLVSAYLSFNTKPMIHSFTMPLIYDENIFGAVIGLQEGERSTVAEDMLLESFTALLSLNVIAREKATVETIDKDIIDQERLSAILDTAVTVNHEVNNPLTAILGNIQLLLLSKDNLSGELVKKLKTIEESALRIKDVTQRLMNLTTSKTVRYDDGTKMVDLYGDKDSDKDKE